MAAPDLDKICNIAGYPIYSWTADQLNIRANKGATPKRSDDDLLYLANKGAWIRVISSIDLNKDATSPDGKLTKYVAGLMPSPSKDISKDNLAKDYILYGGTSTYISPDISATSNIGAPTRAGGSMLLRSGVGADGAYSMLGKKEVQNFGYRPMPGITSMTIESIGRLGALRQATIKFKVWDKSQLDLMDVLYFRLGYSIIIEWGHAKYYDNRGVLQSSEQYMIDPFSNQGKTKEDISIQLNINAQRSYGNYGGMFGVITNFEFSYSQEGGYDCTIKALSMGAVFGNMPINRPSILSKVYENNLDKFLNNERAKKIEEEKRKAEQKKLDELDKLNRALRSDLWAEELRINSTRFDGEDQKMDPGIPDAPIATLIYNTNNLGDSLQNINTILNSRKNAYGVTTEGYTVPDKVKDYKELNNISYSNYFTRQELNPYRADNLILKLGEAPGALNKAGNNYWIQGENIIYYQKFLKYIDADKDITVTLDTIRLDELAKKENNLPGGLDDAIKRGYLLYGEVDYEMAPDATDPNLYSKPGFKFTVTFTYPKNTGQSMIMSPIQIKNKDTKYKVVAIGNRKDDSLNFALSSNALYIKLAAVDNPDIIVELGGATEGLPDFNPFNIYTADLNLITNIEYPNGFNDLTKNKAYEDYKPQADQIRQQAVKDLETIQGQLDAEINAVKKTTETSSAIELMLKSILLYGITFEGEIIETDYINNLIKPLFSEGAYSQFFSNGYPTDKGLPNDLFNRYINKGLTKEQRLLVNLLYGNNYQLLSCENVLDSNGKPKDMLSIIPKVDFGSLCRLVRVPYGETPYLGDSKLFESEELKKSVYINLGFFLLMLNHTAILYTSDEKKAKVITPMSYVDFNPGTNFYLSSINQISINPHKFLIGYYGTVEDYKSLFDKSLINDEGNFINVNLEEIDLETGKPKKIPYTEPTLFNPEYSDQVTYILPKTQKKNLKGDDNPYVGRLMDVSVNVNYLLRMIRQYATSNNSHEVYFQTVIERILDDLYKSTGNYNAFTLSYNDSGNCYHITDDQIQPADSDLVSVHSKMINDNAYEIPMYNNNGKTSIVRSFDIKTDISNRISSMISIAANPTVDSQVGLGKDTSDFGIYNLGTEDRYKKLTVDSKNVGPDKDISDNGQMAQIAINFNKVVNTIYATAKGKFLNERITSNLTDEEIDRAAGYYIERMSYVKNEQSGSVHSLVIPIKSSITMDGISSLYPFQLFTVPELLLPYRYSVSNLDKKVGFSITKIVHNFEGSQWTTQFDGLMTLLKDKSYYEPDKKLRKPRKPFIPVDTTKKVLDTSPVNVSKYSSVLTPEFLKKLDEVCNYLGCKRDDMLRVMYAESRFDPKSENKLVEDRSTAPAGLIQISKENYGTVGVTSKQQIIQTSAIKQLDYVKKYFEQYKGNLGNLYLLYGATFLPNKILYNLDDDNYVLAEAGTKRAIQNPNMLSADGSITIGSFKQYVINISYLVNQ